MTSSVCPNLLCKNVITNLPDNFNDIVQCSKCASIVRVVTRDGRTAYATIHGIELDVPAGLPSDLNKILTEAIACYEVGSNAATVVLAGLFIEGLLIKIGIKSDRLVEMIEQAHKEGIVSTLGYHVATASRLLRNIGAHYSDELVQLDSSDARLVLEMTRKLAGDIIASGKLPES
jgi:hypothetical protein